MPVWVLKLLPYAGAVLLVGIAVAWIDHRGYKRAETAADLAKQRDENNRLTMRNWMLQQMAHFHHRLQESVQKSDQNLNDHLSRLDVVEKTIIQPTITREINNGPARLTDPDAGLTDGLLRIINFSRARSGSPCITQPDGSATCELPEPQSGSGQEDSHPGK